jgi:hypothetical protein
VITTHFGFASHRFVEVPRNVQRFRHLESSEKAVFFCLSFLNSSNANGNCLRDRSNRRLKTRVWSPKRSRATVASALRITYSIPPDVWCNFCVYQHDAAQFNILRVHDARDAVPCIWETPFRIPIFSRFSIEFRTFRVFSSNPFS